MEVLGLPPGTVDEDAVRTAFRRLAKATLNTANNANKAMPARFLGDRLMSFWNVGVCLYVCRFTKTDEYP